MTVYLNILEKGIDVSKWNGSINWQSVKNSGVDYVIIRGGYGTSTVDSQFKNYIEDDLNTSNMITLVYDILKDTSVNDGTKRKLIEKFDEVLSLDLLKVDEVSSEHDDEEILKKIELRNEAKKNKDFVTADAIRDELLEQGVRLIDTREGTTYELI